MLSTAAAALLAGQAFADTTIDKSTTAALTTGPLETITSTTSSTGTATASGTGNAGNITIQTGGTVAPSIANQGAITVNSNFRVERGRHLEQGAEQLHRHSGRHDDQSEPDHLHQHGQHRKSAARHLQYRQHRSDGRGTTKHPTG